MVERIEKFNGESNDDYNELPCRKQRGINSLQLLLTRAASCGELDPLSD
jgi:hypothetical protein